MYTTGDTREFCLKLKSVSESLEPPATPGWTRTWTQAATLRGSWPTEGGAVRAGAAASPPPGSPVVGAGGGVGPVAVEEVEEAVGGAELEAGGGGEAAELEAGEREEVEEAPRGGSGRARWPSRRSGGSRGRRTCWCPSSPSPGDSWPPRRPWTCSASRPCPGW